MINYNLIFQSQKISISLFDRDYHLIYKKHQLILIFYVIIIYICYKVLLQEFFFNFLKLKFYICN